MKYNSVNRVRNVVQQVDFPDDIYIDNDFGLIVPIKEFISLGIPINNSFGMTVQIDKVFVLCEDKIRLSSTFDDETFELVFSMNIGEEVFEIYDEE